ncbi:hypothetical protein [Chroococcidiopsis sp. CCALA 051]|nr:hypothetical protein [Chroococcidiopsis sp. CCALA 051]
MCEWLLTSVRAGLAEGLTARTRNFWSKPAPTTSDFWLLNY